MNEYEYQFPRNNRAGCIDEQLKHAAGEIVEATAEVGCVPCAVEIMDAIECLEGALRAIDDNCPGTVTAAYIQHYKKNKARGDYERR